MTKAQMQDISQQIISIDRQLDLLSPDNAIESQQRERLLQRLDFIEFQLDRFIISERKKHLRLI